MSWENKYVFQCTVFFIYFAFTNGGTPDSNAYCQACFDLQGNGDLLPRRHGPDFHPRGTQFIWDSGVSVFPQMKANQNLCFCFCFNSRSVRSSQHCLCLQLETGTLVGPWSDPKFGFSGAQSPDSESDFLESQKCFLGV